MQVRLGDGESKKIAKIDHGKGCAIVTADECSWFAPWQRAEGEPCYWNDGDVTIEWTPPTDAERRLFMEAARHCASAGADGWCTGYCDWCNDTMQMDPGVQYEIAESLALDGADYDDMPDFEELER